MTQFRRVFLRISLVASQKHKCATFDSITPQTPPRPPIDEAAQKSYELSEAAYAANELEETWVHRLLAVLTACFAFVQPLLAETLYEGLVDNVLDKVCFCFPLVCH